MKKVTFDANNFYLDGKNCRLFPEQFIISEYCRNIGKIA